MTLKKLHNNLQKLGIPEDRYYLHGLCGSTNDDHKLALTIKMGKYSVEYEIYFKELGEKHSVRVFATENEACQYMYERLKENKNLEDKYFK